MNGLIAVTDHDWFEFLDRHADLDEVNFWQPAGPRPPRNEIRLPERVEEHPSPKWLEWHMEERFRR